MSAARPFIQRPVAALRVGVTGTRSLPPGAVAELRRLTSNVLRHIKHGVTKSAESPSAASVYEGAQPKLRLLSPLAEGSDRLLAEEAVALNYELIVPMPFAQAEYEKDFPQSLPEFRRLLTQAKTVFALDGARGDDETTSYAAAGRLVVRNCDLLIAIWDGEKSRGRGGTAEIIRYGIGYEQPVWWLHPDGDREPVWIENLAQLENKQCASRGSAAVRALDRFLERTITPPEQPRRRGKRIIFKASHALKRAAPQPGQIRDTALTTFLREKPRPRRAIWTIHSKVLCWLAGTPPRNHAQPMSLLPDDEVWTYWQALYAASDRLSLDCAGRYRTSYLLVFAAAAVALACTASALAFQTGERLATGLELLLLGGITAIVTINDFQDWHGRLIAYRLLAELFRKQQALALFVWTIPLAEAADVFGGEAETKGAAPRDDFVTWYFNAMLRQAPLRGRALSGPSLSTTYETICQSLISGQVEYHTQRRQETQALAHWLTLIGDASFLLALALVALKLLLMLEQDVPPPQASGAPGFSKLRIIGFAAILLPALSAASLGIRGYSELEILAEQSDEMLRLFTRTKTKLKLIDLAKPLASQKLGAEFLALAQRMLVDNRGWAQLVRVKSIEP